MKRQSHLAIGLGLTLVVTCLAAEARAYGGGRYAAQIEPTAGTWQHVGHFLRQGLPRAGASRIHGHGSRAGHAREPRQPERRRDPPANRVLGCRGARLSLDRSDQRAPPRRNGDDSVSASRLRVRGAGHVRRHDRDVGVEVRLQPAASERATARSADGPAGPEQPVVSLGARGDGAGRRVRARVFPACGGAVLPVHGRGSGLVPRARRPSIPQRLHGGARARPEGGRAGHREGEDGRLGRRLDRHRADRARASGSEPTRAT